MEAQWEVWGGGIPLVILPSPYRSFLVPCLAYIGEIREKDPDRWVTVILPEVIPVRWWQNLSTTTGRCLSARRSSSRPA